MTKLSIEKCEKIEDIVFCPNRFTGFEMFDIGVALDMMLDNFDLMKNEFTKAKKNTLIIQGEVIQKKDLTDKIKSIKELKKKVNKLIEMADAFHECGE
jgi:hypothetical protein